MIYVKELERIRGELCRYRDGFERELALLPEGDYFSYVKRGVRYYCERMPKKGNAKKEHREALDKDSARLRALVRKVYVKRALSIIEKDISLLDSVGKRFRAFDENSVMEGFVEKYPEMIGYAYQDRMGLEEWAKGFEPPESFHVENLKSTSVDGSKRRSLGEIIIGSRLNFYGIPYRYEQSFDHPNLPYSPDFTIIRPRDGKTIYWEHFGMVNDKGYMERNRRRLQDYEEYGIVPWDNLIISYSQQDGGINEKLIDALIQGWLL